MEEKQQTVSIIYDILCIIVMIIENVKTTLHDW